MSTTTHERAALDILPFGPAADMPTEKTVILSLTPEVVARIAASGLGVAFCESVRIPTAFWIETTRPASGAIAVSTL